MGTKEKRNISGIFLKLARVMFGVATILVFLYFIVGEIVAPSEQGKTQIDSRVFEAQWEQLLESGERIPVEVPGKLDAEYGEVVTLVTELPKQIRAEETICFRLIWQDAEIYVDGVLREHYTTKDTRPFGTNSAFRYVFLDLEEEDAGKELELRISSNSKYAGTTRESYIGEKTSIWKQVINQFGVKAIIALFLFFLSVFCIIVSVILKWIYKIDMALDYLAWTVFLCATWMLSEIEFRQLFIRNMSILSSITYWSLMLIPIPLLTYINEIQKHRYAKIYIPPMIYSMCVLVFGTILQVLDKVQFVEQIPYIHMGNLISIVCIIVTITLDTVRKQVKDYAVVGVGVYGLLVAAALEMVLYHANMGISLGTILAMGLLVLLITAIIKTGQDLFRSEKHKQQAIAAKESQAKFLANMSHEIRTPINAVIGMNEMILRESESDAVQEYARNIQSASNMLLGLINEILDFSKIESGQLELVEDTYQLAPLIQDELLLLNARVGGKAISVKVDVDPGLPSRFKGDELRIKQILTNLLSNAVKYTKEGMVSFKVFFKWIDSDTIDLGFAVKDTGTGIKKEDQAQLFDSFKRFELNNNRNIEGTGLGLSIVKQLVELMNGQITVESVYGKGSTFTVIIPQKIMDKRPIGSIETSLRESRKEEEKSANFFTAEGVNVLVVDDNTMNLSLMKSLLKRTKMNVELASGGVECVELTRKKAYDIIMLDHMMPEMDGVEVLHKIRSEQGNPNKDTKIIALTANAIAGSREMYLKYGFDDYLSKPIQAKVLDELLMRHLTENSVPEQPETKEVPKQEVKTVDLMRINKALGLSYCMDSEELYDEILSVFCEQCREYLPKLETYFKEQDWKQYAIIAHALKGNSLNIGAEDFSKYSLQHELAGKEDNAEFIQKEYADYVDALKRLMSKVEARDI